MVNYQFRENNMKVQFILTIISSLCIICTGLNSTKAMKLHDPDAYLNSIQFIRRYGYPAEAHAVETADGYLLQMHRIPHGKYSSEQELKKKPPVLLHHGLLGSSFDFLVIGPEQGLAFLLADMGFDVWLANARGNKYSRGHVRLTPEDKEFWNFSWHESAIYDVPAQIDYICNHTKQEKIAYVGFSMGTTIFYVTTSLLPEYNEKIEVSLLMASVGYAEYLRSPLLRALVPIFPKIKGLVEFISNGEFLGGGALIQFLGKIFCEMNIVESRLCLSAIFLITGSDYSDFDMKLVNKFVNHYPAGYSIKGLNHYSQEIKSGKFRQYDYGKSENYRRYGSPYPPDYPVENITVPMYIYEGKNDLLSTIADAKHLAKRLKTLKRFHVVESPDFSHLDFIMSSNIKEQLYNSLLQDMTSALK